MLTEAIFESQSFCLFSFCLFIASKVSIMNVYLFCYEKFKKENHLFSGSPQSKKALLFFKLLFSLFCIYVYLTLLFLKKFSFSSSPVPWGQALYCILLYDMHNLSYQPHHNTFECRFHTDECVLSDPCPAHLQFVSSAWSSPRAPCDSLWISKAVA